MFSGSRVLQLVDDVAKQRGLAFAGIASDPEWLAVMAVAPLLELSVLGDPTVAMIQQATFGSLNATLVVKGICSTRVSYASPSSVNFAHELIESLTRPRTVLRCDTDV